MAKQDEYARYTIRIPAELYERLKASAGDKSVNAEIIARLEGSYRTEDALPLLDASLSGLESTLNKETAIFKRIIEAYSQQTSAMQDLIESVVDGGPVLDTKFYDDLKLVVEKARSQRQSGS